QALNASLQAALGQPKPEEQLTVRPMRIGTATFLYITPATRGGSSLQCGRELIAALLADGHSRTTAAALLAQGAAGDTESAGRIRDEYLAHPEIERLMWLAL